MTRAEACERGRARQTALRRIRLNELADRVADGQTIRAAAEAMGICEATAWNYWAEVRASLEVAA